MSKIEENVEKLVKSQIEDLGYELYDVEFVKEGKNYFLKIFIDKPSGIDLNDCEKVTNGISDLLDASDYIKEYYFLEVSSPGIERILRKDEHFKKNIGQKIEIKLFKKDDTGKKEYVGILSDFDKEFIVINSENEDISIDRKSIAHVKTVYEW